jgi:hypothetical protein
MRSVLSTFVGAVILIGSAQLVFSQRQRASPHEKVEATIGGKKITIDYGRPYKKGREIFGKLEPYGKVWRTGADEATTLTTEGDLMIGSIHVPAGTYSLFTIPDEKEWTLVVNKVAKQWGAFKYDQAMDLGRTKMKIEKVPAVEQLTIAITPKGANAGELSVAWDTTKAVAPIMTH